MKKPTMAQLHAVSIRQSVQIQNQHKENEDLRREVLRAHLRISMLERQLTKNPKDYVTAEDARAALNRRSCAVIPLEFADGMEVQTFEDCRFEWQPYQPPNLNETYSDVEQPLPPSRGS